MTRDEAIKIMSRIWGGTPQHDLGIRYVEAFVALGMLKLDEPKSIEKRIYDFCYGKINDGWLKTELDKAGLKIIEK